MRQSSAEWLIRAKHTKDATETHHRGRERGQQLVRPGRAPAAAPGPPPARCTCCWRSLSSGHRVHASHVRLCTGSPGCVVEYLSLAAVTPLRSVGRGQLINNNSAGGGWRAADRAGGRDRSAATAHTWSQCGPGRSADTAQMLVTARPLPAQAFLNLILLLRIQDSLANILLYQRLLCTPD